MVPAPEHPNTQQPSWMTSASEDEEDITHIAQDILWQTVNGMKRKKQGEKNIDVQRLHHSRPTSR